MDATALLPPECWQAVLSCCDSGTELSMAFACTLFLELARTRWLLQGRDWLRTALKRRIVCVPTLLQLASEEEWKRSHALGWAVCEEKVELCQQIAQHGAAAFHSLNQHAPLHLLKDSAGNKWLWAQPDFVPTAASFWIHLNAKLAALTARKQVVQLRELEPLLLRLPLQTTKLLTTGVSGLLRLAARSGVLCILEWAKAVGVSRQKFMVVDNDVLMCAAANGHLHVMKWLHAALHYTAEEVKQQYFFLYRVSCRHHRLDILRWLVQEFQPLSPQELDGLECDIKLDEQIHGLRLLGSFQSCRAVLSGHAPSSAAPN